MLQSLFGLFFGGIQYFAGGWMCSRACLDFFLGGGDTIFCLFREHNADFSSSSSVPSYTRIRTGLSGPHVFAYL